MKTWSWCLVLSIAVLAVVAQGRYQAADPREAAEDICGLANTAFQDGEQLIYKLYYNLAFIWIPAGEVTFNLTEQDSTYEASIIGRSYGSYDHFLRVRDEFHARIDKSTMMPLSFYRKVEEGDHRRFDSIVMDYNLSLIYSLNGETKQTARSDTFALQECTYDLVSIMYALRNIETEHYGRGDHLRSLIFFDEVYSPIDIEYLKKERKKVKNLGRYATIQVRPQVIIGTVFKEGDEMNVWISDDDNKIPLVIESPIRIGSVKAVLKEYSGLRYDLERR